MHGNPTKKISGIALFLLWCAFILSAFYITQRPLFFQAAGALATAWTIGLSALLVFNSAGIGIFIFKRFFISSNAHERLILGTGLGLGTFGLLGYALAAGGLAHPLLLLATLLGISGWVYASGVSRDFFSSLKSFISSFQTHLSQIPSWLPYVILFSLGLGFGFALLPPAEGFDGLFYHLALPERLLADGKILPYAIPQFWFPGLMEGDFIWALGLGSDRTAQLLHWAFAVLTIALIWEWGRTSLSSQAAWWALALVVSMPSLAWLSAWAYNDFTLVFYELAGLYAFWKWRETKLNSWLFASAVCAGLAMSVKYTSAILPLFCVGALLLYAEKPKRLQSIFYFSLISLSIASPWYLRNWAVMGNPIYPFFFSGRSWDAFEAAAYAGNGTGIGWNFPELISLPLTLTLGHRDQNFYDGRIGPLFLLFLPTLIWALSKKRRAAPAEPNPLGLLAFFSLINYLIWVYGVMQTSHLWQARLLLPGLIPLTLPLGLGITLLHNLNLPRLRVSLMASLIVGLVLCITLLDNTLLLLVRRPLQSAFGLETRAAYFERIQPQYSEALTLVNGLPKDAFTYFLFEPRSYAMRGKTQPDPINVNLTRDYYLYGTPEKILRHWKTLGYTHTLTLAASRPDVQSQIGLLRQLTNRLILVKKTESYELYLIP
ncbi:MAG: glycosyltransferase family 39 protein [Anaerolineales bacterium]|nr:glycosyltransferase family 39 protein [Anaerolineales bacterium]